MEQKVCQSCGMPMEKEEHFGTEKDGAKSADYCTYCYQGGAFVSPDMTMAQMVEICVPYLVQGGMAEAQARSVMESTLPQLKRWQAV